MNQLPSKECQICMETKVVLKVLPCRHEFCLVCVERVQNGRPSFPCPNCQTDVNLGDAMAESLPNRYYGFLKCEKSECGRDQRTDRIRWCEECHALMCFSCAEDNAHFQLDHSTHEFRNLDSVKAACTGIQTLTMMGEGVGTVSGTFLSRDVAMAAVDSALASSAPIGPVLNGNAGALHTGEPRIVVVGGKGREGKGEFYYPNTQRPSTTFDLRQYRYRRHAAATTNSGRTLLSGGQPALKKDPFTSTAFLQGTQEVDAPALPHPRTGHGGSAIDETVFVLGGWDGKTPLSSCVALKDQGQTWTTIGSMNKLRSSFATIASPNPSIEIHAIGGWNGFASISTVKVYDAGSGKWTTAAPLPQALSQLAGAYSDGRIYVCGGKTASNLNSAVASVYSVDPRVGKWDEETLMNTRCCGHCVVPINGSIYVLGGADSSGNCLSTVDVFEPRNKTWVYTKNLEMEGSYSTATVDFS